MILELVGVVTDATVPAGTIAPKVPTRQDILLPRGEPLTIKLVVYKQNHTVKSLAAITTIKLGVRQFRDESASTLTKTAAVTDAPAGKADIVIAAADTESLHELALYYYDIQLTESGARWQLVPYSHFRIAPIVNRVGD